uniref:FAD/NAD(P)-binding domain-containing protein n=1 Tax=Mycena chlorophos TaxID=658473 RepID=A0ABQ0MCJ4_MYCCL|nr:predicted protein [Mycena chlorophos]
MASDGEGDFDIVVLGTGLTESIAAAALAKAGFKVAHLDSNAHYGAAEASLSFDELLELQSQPSPRFSKFSRTADTIPQPRAYSLSLSPSLIPSTGPLIDALVGSGVSRYGGFRLLERGCVYDPSGTAQPVPGSKENIFKSRSISLLEKRRLMRFLQFAASTDALEDRKEMQGNAQTPFPVFLKTVFSLNDDMVNAIAYALAYCLTPNEPAQPVLHRLRRYLRAAGRYGASPFLIAHYGGSGEIAQGFCRTAAVGGAVYILGRKITNISSTEDGTRHAIQVEDVPDVITCSLLVGGESGDVVPLPQDDLAPVSSATQSYPVARCIAVVDQPVLFNPPPEPEADAEEVDGPAPEPTPADTAVLVFPPSSLPNDGSTTASATVLITGEGTMSCPRGKWILYIALPLVEPTDADADPQTLLKPYLDATLALASPNLEPLFATYYLQTPSPAPAATATKTPASLVPAPLPPLLPLPDAGDAAAVHAAGVYWAAMRRFKPGNEVDELEAAGGIWPAMESGDGDTDE